MDIFTLFEFGFLGTVIGFLAGFFGIGGGLILTPTLMLLGLSMKEAIGVSVIMMVFSSIFGTFLNFRSKSLTKLDVKNGAIIGCGGAIGASLSGFFVTNLPEIYLKFGLLFVLGVAVVKMFFTPSNAPQSKEIKPLVFFVLGLFIGAFAMSIGVGGGVILTPVLIGFLHVDIKKAVPMGLFFVLFSSISGFISLGMHGMLNYKLGTISGIGALFGVYFGIKMCHLASKQLQKKLMIALYLVLFVITLFKILR